MRFHPFSRVPARWPHLPPDHLPGLPFRPGTGRPVSQRLVALILLHPLLPDGRSNPHQRPLRMPLLPSICIRPLLYAKSRLRKYYFLKPASHFNIILPVVIGGLNVVILVQKIESTVHLLIASSSVVLPRSAGSWLRRPLPSEFRPLPALHAPR